MDAVVVRQTLFVGESLAAKNTAERLFSSVNTLMGFEVALRRETLAAL